MTKILFYGIAMLALGFGMFMTDRRVYAHTKHPHATHSAGMGLIGVTAGMGVSSFISILSA